MRVLAQAGGVECRHAEVGDLQPEAVLARGALLEITEGDERDHITMGGRARHAEIVGDIRDPEDGTLGREAGKNRKPTLERLRVARFT